MRVVTRESFKWIFSLFLVSCAAPPTTSQQPVIPISDSNDAGVIQDTNTPEGENPGGDSSVPAAPDDSSPDGDLSLAGEDQALEEDQSPDDGFEEDLTDQEGFVAQTLPPHPLEKLTDQELEARYLEDPESIGPMSIGRTNSGALMGGVQMPEGPDWIVRTPRQAWGTQETVDNLSHCIGKVAQDFPDTKALYIGHLSRKRGGRFPPHISHQSGRDVDLGYYYTTDDQWYARAHWKNLDRPRTWALVRCFVTDTDVELILIDRRIQRLLREHAQKIGEDSHWLDQLFGGKTATQRALIRHARGHATHIHARFYNPIAQETGRRMYNILVKHQKIRPPTFFIRHRVRKGQTLAYLSRRYRVSARAIRRANRMRGTMIRAGRIYKIPRRGGVRPPQQELEKIVIPPRRLPPEKTTPLPETAETAETKS